MSSFGLWARPGFRRSGPQAANLGPARRERSGGRQGRSRSRRHHRSRPGGRSYRNQARSYKNGGTYQRANRPVMDIVMVYGSAMMTILP